ncbi:hypothetical protein CACET_c00890 [Clostridium aceticum]|uniref:DUF7922 domain-containing protein n=1 Tax=Clostridium aceticum TaxID=84022 RepID=A0A0G3W6S9_9CLOT|nr:hypothetical protein [Clostridium aceticum]AKL93607.1 hypothetical protein CACET_c00890 [Clostridium aceticum]
MKRRYRRYFVMLEEEDKGYSISKSEGTKGYGKIEVRNNNGTLSLHCQNLKKLEEKKESYRLYLIQTKNVLEPIVVDIGPVKVEGSGKGEIIWEFNSENVKGSKKTIEDFDTLTLVVETIEESQRVIIPLVGYIHKEKTNWRAALQKNLFIASEVKKEKPVDFQRSAEKVQEKSEEKIQVKPEEKMQEKLEEKVKVDKPKQEKLKEEKPKEEKSKEEKSKEEKPIEPAKEKIKEDQLKEEKTQESNSLEIKENSLEENLSHKKPESQYSFEKDWDIAAKEIPPLQKYIESTLKVFPRVEPFDEKLQDYEWWQIQYNTQTIYRAYMPFISHIEMMINPYYYHYSYYLSSEYQKQLYRYQHYIFGVCYDDNKRAKYYIYGIPGKKITKEQPYQGKTGFVYWHPSHYAQFKQEGFGYWLMHIDAETGKMVEPLSQENI